LAVNTLFGDPSQGPPSDAAAISSQLDAIAVSGDSVYFLTVSPPTLWRVPVGGGPISLVRSLSSDAGLLGTPTGVVLTQSSFEAEAGEYLTEILFLPNDGSPAVGLAGPTGHRSSIVTDGKIVYFSDSDGTKAVGLNGGAPQLLTHQTGVLGLTASEVLIADTQGGSVFRIPKTGGTLDTLASGQSSPGSPVACGDDVCWINALPCYGVQDGGGCIVGQGAWEIVRLQLGGSPSTIAFDVGSATNQMLADSQFFYVMESVDASPNENLLRVPLAGGAPVALGAAVGLALAGGCLFVTATLCGIYSVTSSDIPDGGFCM
jgi:hypothetical protein